MPRIPPVYTHVLARIICNEVQPPAPFPFEQCKAVPAIHVMWVGSDVNTVQLLEQDELITRNTVDGVPYFEVTQKGWDAYHEFFR